MRTVVATRHASVLEEVSRRLAFVKVARGPSDRRELAREASMYSLIAARCPDTSLHLPGMIAWDPTAGRLALEALAGRDLGAVVRGEGVLPPEMARAAGTVAATLHEEGAALAHEPVPPAQCARAMGWHRPTPADLRVLSLGGIELIEVLQSSDALCAGLDRAADGAAGDDTLVHGDLRWENVFVVGGNHGPPSIRLVDWEMAGRGEAVWDVACFIAACLGAWLCTIPHVPGVSPAELTDLAAVPLSAVRPAIAAFADGYRDARTMPLGRVPAWTVRCAELVGVRLVHLAVEATRDDEYLQAGPVAHLQVALNVMEDPARAARDLLGIAA